MPAKTCPEVPRLHVLWTLQGWGLHHCPGQPGPMPREGFFFLCIKFFLLWCGYRAGGRRLASHLLFTTTVWVIVQKPGLCCSFPRNPVVCGSAGMPQRVLTPGQHPPPTLRHRAPPRPGLWLCSSVAFSATEQLGGIQLHFWTGYCEEYALHSSVFLQTATPAYSYLCLTGLQIIANVSGKVLAVFSQV